MDLISRQAAIDAVNRLSLGETDAVRLSMKIADYLNRMPPAQPEIIRCKDCRHRIVNDYYGEKLNIKGYCELDTGDPFELGRDAQNDDWFCAETKEEHENPIETGIYNDILPADIARYQAATLYKPYKEN